MASNWGKIVLAGWNHLVELSTWLLDLGSLLVWGKGDLPLLLCLSSWFNIVLKSRARGPQGILGSHKYLLFKNESASESSLVGTTKGRFLGHFFRFLIFKTKDTDPFLHFLLVLHRQLQLFGSPGCSSDQIKQIWPRRGLKCNLPWKNTTDWSPFWARYTCRNIPEACLCLVAPTHPPDTTGWLGSPGCCFRAVSACRSR